ncbi:TetR/AcrR family transcriptional regulator [Evansella cellulosilytica]|uniref:Regulatory protein TetR n=1 Tax=Evansella cellulosilytica (strain ATCC 21833 / DSM 2522 / FERM P-1141 / JCM 9156 / N-4) TaxID=649639 RepID=E6TY27_EVAC2|nr:TetR/AcrR family transcriptional regulator [Evansella cellulosilytica]ADU31240.1 regulatory protein TetR [Evansella cellulosilytica DSM 2522]
MEQQNEMFMSTEDQILGAAIDLMEKRGFKAVTTKEIAAEAGFSEMTLFRRFGTKKKLLEAAVERYSYIIDMENIFQKYITYELEEDLMLVSKTYHRYMIQNQKIVLLAFQERNTYPMIAEKTAESPKILKDYLVRYFTEMQKREKIIAVDSEIQAMSFLWMNFGYFMSRYIAGESVSQVPLSTFIDESVKAFSRGIKKEAIIVY